MPTVDQLAQKLIRNLADTVEPEQQIQFIVVKRGKFGLSCLAGFRKDKPVFAPKIALAQRFESEEAILAVVFDGQAIRPDFHGVEIWSAPQAR